MADPSAGRAAPPAPVPADRPLRDPWIIAQLALAGLLAAISLVGVIPTLAFDAAEFTFTLQGAIQAFAIFPGLVVSLVVNAFLMRAHRRRGAPVMPVQKTVVGIEFGLIAVLLVCHFWNGPGGELFGLAILVWPLAILVAITVAVVALVVLSRSREATAASSA